MPDSAERWVALSALVAGLAVPGMARADENGVPFWLSGQQASFAAVPATPGWGLTLLPYGYSGNAGGNASFPRGNGVASSLDAQLVLGVALISFAPETKVLGGQLNLGVAVVPGVSETSASATAAFGGIPVPRNVSQSIAGFGDLYPIASIAWNQGVNNYMTYVTGDIPVGAYSATNLANLGIGHGAIDAGGAYTYFNPKTGREFSVTGGATFNFQNPATDYTNGVDLHLDWEASQFITQQVHVGLVGYVHQQITPDQYPTAGLAGAARARLLGSFESAVASVGPEVGFFFKFGAKQAYLNLRGYDEFWAQNRVKGYAGFATLHLPLGG
jgi:hypothetical protein